MPVKVAHRFKILVTVSEHAGEIATRSEHAAWKGNFPLDTHNDGLLMLRPLTVHRGAAGRAPAAEDRRRTWVQIPHTVPHALITFTQAIKENAMARQLNRRDFLRTAAVVGGATGFPAIL